MLRVRLGARRRHRLSLRHRGEKERFFKSAVALFVGKQVAQSLDRSQQIGLTGKRQMVTILFTDIRGFTAFCESKDPAVVVDLLNVYMATMCSIILQA